MINTKPRLFLDMDGFLVNFSKAVCRLFRSPYPKAAVLGYDYWKECGVSSEEFKRKISRSANWWASLEPHPYAKDFLHWATRHNIEWNILSSTMPQSCTYEGKARWVLKHLGVQGMARLILVMGDKGRIARRGDLLVDDGPHNWTAWERAGGETFCWLEMTPDHPELPAQLDRLKNFIIMRCL